MAIETVAVTVQDVENKRPLIDAVIDLAESVDSDLLYVQGEAARRRERPYSAVRPRRYCSTRRVR